MKNKYLITGIVLIVLVATLFPRGKENITIGVIAPMTGIVASFGEDIQKGVIAGMNGTSTVIFEDDKCEPSTAVSAFNKLVDINKISLIIGPACGSPQEAIVPILKNKDAVVIVPSAASEKLFTESAGKLFNLQYSLENEAAFLAKSMDEGGLKKVVIITYQNAFSKTMNDNFKSNFKGEIVKEVTFVDGTSDISTEIAKLKGLQFDAILSTDITFFFVQGLQKLKQFAITAPVYSEYAVELPMVRPLVEGVYYSYPGGIEGNGGAVLELSKQASQISKDATGKCANDTDCIKKYLMNTGLFDSNGTSKREIILKQIKGGITTNL